jgi:hypothetical protein
MDRPSPIALRPSPIAHRLIAAAAFLITINHSSGQGIYIPPDIYPDAGMGTTFLRENHGQIRKTDGSGCEAYFYYERTPFGLYLMKHSVVSFTLAALHHDTITPDTLWRVDMKLDKGKDVAPISVGASVPGHNNYYLGSVTAEDVLAYNRVVYPSVWDSIDVHLYHGSSGPRMAFVVKPGGDPSEIQLKFEGQDSLTVDWQGALKVYMGEKWLKLEQAMAYQVAGTTVVPLWWSATYDHADGSAYVGFDFDAYNPALPLVFQIGYPPLPGALGGGDPDYRNLSWCTYASANEGDELQSVELDAEGNPYVCGFAHQLFYPVALGEWIFEPWEEEPASAYNATITKFNHATKEVYWSTYYGGFEVEGLSSENRTDAYKLAVFNGASVQDGYVFVTGSTNCVDVQIIAFSNSRFDNADQTPYDGGIKRMWLGAFRRENGVCHWSTTHGETGGTRTWNEHGLAIDADETGRLVVGGKIETYFDGQTIPNFPRVTPTGAFTRAVGDGFFIVYDSDYQIEWSSTFCEFSGGAAHGGVFDLELAKSNLIGGEYGFYMVGATADLVNIPFDLQPPATGGYFQAVAGPVSAFLAYVNTSTKQLDYSTRWGSPNANSGTMGAAFGLAGSNQKLWVTGFTNASNLTSTQLPPPAAPSGALWTTTNNSVFPQSSDGFVLRFNIDQDLRALEYGTLVGGSRDDILLDVAFNGIDRVYFTGETRSYDAISIDLNPDYYYQEQVNLPARDAILMAMNAGADPALEWSTKFGGTRSDRGWGVAANTTELYLCGTTASQGPLTPQLFPLREFSTTSNLDYFQEVNLGGSASEWVPWRDFRDAMDYEDIGIDQFIIEPWMEEDGFIACFLMQGGVEVPEVAKPQASAMQLFATADHATWIIRFDDFGPWNIRVFNSAGSLTHTASMQGQGGLLHLGEEPPGMYLVEAVHPQGQRHTGKIVKP